MGLFMDATGSVVQWLDPVLAEYPESGAGDDIQWATSRIGGWYTVDCRPLHESQVVFPVTELHNQKS